MPLQNRVTPFGELVAAPARGLLMGNRGGRLHRDDRALGERRWTSRAWICCRLAFKDRHRVVWSKGYTELFFLDEVTALAAGHRPCFECRRADADAFAALWASAVAPASRARAAEMDKMLHAERLAGRAKRLHRMPIADLPDGAMIALDEQSGVAFALRGGRLLRWAPDGYVANGARPRGGTVEVLTPPSILRVISTGYRPFWHASADDPRNEEGPRTLSLER
jgi:hypothetical protein